MSQITISTKINTPLQKAWELFTKPEHITKWNFASPGWHCPKAEVDLRVGGKFTYRMEAKDQTEGFDFGGTYNEIKPNELIKYTMDDGRKARVIFAQQEDKIKITITFEPESENPQEMQKQGWQAILNNFKKYTEKQ